MNKIKQELSINGVKFFQDALYKIKIFHEESPLSAAAIGTYILFHFKCNDLGRINANEFSLMDWANSTGIPYTTLHSGREVLFERELIEEVIINNEPYYQIIGYDKWNSPEIKVPGQNYKLSYFRISYRLLTSPLLKNLISSRNATGLILLLDLFNRITRTLGEIKKNKGKLTPADVKGLTLEYTMKTLKEKTKKNALKVRQLLEMLASFFEFQPVGYSERNPRKDRATPPKKKNVVQKVIRKFVVSINPEILKYEEDTLQTQTLEATLRKEVVSKLDLLGISHYRKDIKNVMSAFKQEVIKVLQFAPLPFKERNRAIANVFSESLNEFIAYYENATNKKPDFKIHSLGAIFRTFFSKTFTWYLEREFDSGERIEIAVGFHKKYGVYPKHLNTSK